MCDLGVRGSVMGGGACVLAVLGSFDRGEGSQQRGYGADGGALLGVQIAFLQRHSRDRCNRSLLRCLGVHLFSFAANGFR